MEPNNKKPTTSISGNVSNSPNLNRRSMPTSAQLNRRSMPTSAQLNRRNMPTSMRPINRNASNLSPQNRQFAPNGQLSRSGLNLNNTPNSLNLNRNNAPSGLNQSNASSNRPPMRPSAEDRFNKSFKNLAYTSGGGGGALNMASSSSSQGKHNAHSHTPSRKKVGGVVLDMETIQDANKQRLEKSNKRNNVIIVVLSMCLVVSLVYLAIAILGFNNSKREPNCMYSVVGGGKAEWIIEGENDTEFVLRQGLARDHIYLLESSLKIKTTETVTLSIEINVLLDGEPILIAGLQDKNSNLIRVANTNQFVYQATITGGGTIHLFKGIDFSEAPNNLTSDNVVIEVIANVEVLSSGEGDGSGDDNGNIDDGNDGGSVDNGGDNGTIDGGDNGIVDGGNDQSGNGNNEGAGQDDGDSNDGDAGDGTIVLG